MTGARNQLANTRAQQQFTVPDPDQYPATPVTTAEDFSTAQIETTAAETSFRPVKTGFMLTVGVGLALGLYLIVSSNVQLLVWMLAALFITLGLDPVVAKIHCWGASWVLGPPFST